jgi:uncharacterized protein (TIRG00374 family)
MAASRAHQPGSDPQRRPSNGRRRVVRSIVMLAVGGLSLYLLLPALVSVFSSWRTLLDADWPFAALVLALEGASYTCLFMLDRITLRSHDWFAISCAVLAGNALGRFVPGAATPFSVELFGEAGFDEGEAAAGLSVSTALQIATALALPILTVPAMLAGVGVRHNLEVATYAGLATLVALLGLGILVMRNDRVLAWIGRMIQAVLNHTVRRRRRVSGLPEELLRDRDFVRSTLDRRWKPALLAAVGNTAFDYLALLTALRAVGADPQPSLVILAYASAEVLALVPFTPGGLGFVETGLVGTLSLAGVSPTDALAATLLYRLVSYWLPIPAGGVAYLLFRRRYPRSSARPPAPAAG